MNTTTRIQPATVFRTGVIEASHQPGHEVESFDGRTFDAYEVLWAAKIRGTFRFFHMVGFVGPSGNYVCDPSVRGHVWDEVDIDEARRIANRIESAS